MRRLFSGPLLAGLLAVPSVASAPVQPPGCWAKPAVEASRIRDLQIMLMAGVLQCRRDDPTLTTAYNRFIDRTRPQLLEGQRHLEAHFANDPPAHDRFTTQLANRYVDVGERPQFCRRIAAVLEADDASNGGVARSIAMLQMTPHGVGQACAGRPALSVAAAPFDRLPE